MRQGLRVVPAMVLILSAVAFCGQNASHKAGIHVVAHAPITCGTGMPSIAGCQDILTTYPDCGDIDVFPVFYDLVQTTEVEYGLSWPSEWGSCAFTSCSDLAMGAIVNPGDGIAHAWYACKVGTVSLPGFGWLWGGTPGMVWLGENPATMNFGTTDCAQPAQGDHPLYWHLAAACGMLGDDPCQPVGFDRRTWGEIKSMFR